METSITVRSSFGLKKPKGKPKIEYRFFNFHSNSITFLPNALHSSITATDENKLRKAFGEFGKVTDVFLPIDRESSRPRGFGFVSFETRAAAEEAISKMDQTELDSRTIRVNESRPKGEEGNVRSSGGGGGFNPTGSEDVKLFVGNLSFESTEETVRSAFEKYGSVSDCFLPTDRESGMSRGFAFVTMQSKDAEKALAEMNGADVDGNTLKVNEAQPKGGPRGGGGRGRGGGGRGRGGGGRGRGGRGRGRGELSFYQSLLQLYYFFLKLKMFHCSFLKDLLTLLFTGY